MLGKKGGAPKPKAAPAPAAPIKPQGIKTKRTPTSVFDGAAGKDVYEAWRPAKVGQGLDARALTLRGLQHRLRWALANEGMHAQPSCARCCSCGGPGVPYAMRGCGMGCGARPRRRAGTERVCYLAVNWDPSDQSLTGSNS